MPRPLATRRSALVCGAALALALTGATAGSALAAGDSTAPETGQRGNMAQSFFGSQADTASDAGNQEATDAGSVNTPATSPDPVLTPETVSAGTTDVPDAPAAPTVTTTAQPDATPEPETTPEADPTPEAEVAPEPAAPATPEPAPVYAVADIEEMCRTQLFFYGADGNVPQEDWLQVVVKDGKVWVLQCEGIAAKADADVPAPEITQAAEAAADQADATDAEPVPKYDYATMDVTARTATRAQLLADLLAGSELVDGNVQTPADEAQAAADQTAPAAAPAATADPKPVPATQVTWVVISQKGGTAVTAFVFDVPTLEDDQAATDADAAASDQTSPAAVPGSEASSSATATTDADAPEPAILYPFDDDDPNLAVASAKGRWTSSTVWPSQGPLADAGVERVAGQTPPFQDGTPIVDPWWVVDQPATSEQVWVEDSAAWSEDVYVVDVAEADYDELIADAWTEYEEIVICYGCGRLFSDLTAANSHKMDMYADYWTYISPGGGSGEYYCSLCDVTIFGEEAANEHAWNHADIHDVISYTNAIYHDPVYNHVHVDEVGHWERVDHEATGHYETVNHDEVGHWEAPTAPLD